MFTSVKTSSYAYPDGTNISGLTDLQDIVQTVEPFSAQVFSETMLQVSARFDNSQVQSAYLIQTLGIYAQVGSGSPVLFAVVQADTPDQMPAQSAVSPSAFIYNIQTTVQQATSLTVSVNPAGTATVQDILDLKNTKVDINRGNISNTVTDVTEPDEDDDYPTIQTSGGVTSAILGGLLRWTKSLKDKKVDSNAGDISATSVVSFTESSAQYPVPSAGDSVKVIAGKIIKFFQDIRSTAIGACYIGQLVSNNTTNNPNLPASAAAVYQEAQLRAQQFAQLNSDKAPVNHSHDDRYYTESEINSKFNAISGAGTLIGELKWLPSGNIDDPNSYLNATGWKIIPYVTYANIDTLESLKWSFVIGIYDHNNGTPKDCQLAIGENGGVRRRYKSSTGWTGWTTI